MNRYTDIRVLKYICANIARNNCIETILYDLRMSIKSDVSSRYRDIKVL